MSDFKSQQIKSVIKDLLKKNKMTYEAVAEELECSVPTVKRILGQEELSLPRLLQFCDLLDVTLTDLETLMAVTAPKREEFTEDQQNFLAKNKSFMAYLMKLYSMTPAEIGEKHKLTARSTDKYLIGLEKQGLIKVTGKLKVRPTYKDLPSLGRGALAKAYYEEFISNGTEFFIKHISETLYSQEERKPEESPKGFAITAFKVTESSYRNFAKEQNRLFETFFKLASYEEKSLPEKDLKTAVFLRAFTLVENDEKSLDLLENTFGDISNF